MVTKEFIQKVRAFLNGESLLLTEVLDWLAVSKPIKYGKTNLSTVLMKLQSILFDPNLPDAIYNKIFDEDEETAFKIFSSYYDIDDPRDWKFAIDKSKDDPYKLSYFNYKNAEKYKVKVYYNHPFVLFTMIKDETEIGIYLHACSDIRIKAKPTSVLKHLIEYFHYQDTKKQQNITDYISYAYSNINNIIIKEVSGEDIKWAYYEGNYAEPTNSSSLWNSCMRYERCQSHLDIYCDNPDKVQMVVALNSMNKVVGRCLLWTPDSDSNVYYDRIYSYSSLIENKILEYCESKGYLWVKQNKFSLEINHARYLDLPYLDNLCYFTKDGIQNHSDEKVICHFQSAGGGHFYHDDEYRLINGVYMHVSEIYSDYLEEYIQGEAETAYYDPTRTSLFPEADVWYSWIEGCNVYIYSEHVVYLEYKDEYAFKVNCVTDIRGNLRHEDDVVYSKYLNAFIFKEEAREHEKEGWVDIDTFRLLQQEETNEVTA